MGLEKDGWDVCCFSAKNANGMDDWARVTKKREVTHGRREGTLSSRLGQIGRPYMEGMRGDSPIGTHQGLAIGSLYQFVIRARQAHDLRMVLHGSAARRPPKSQKPPPR